MLRLFHSTEGAATGRVKKTPAFADLPGRQARAFAHDPRGAAERAWITAGALLVAAASIVDRTPAPESA